MEIYNLNIDDKKYKQYKTHEEALKDMYQLINLNPNSNIEIILEEYCEYENLDVGCKINLLYEYKNLLFKKYL